MTHVLRGKTGLSSRTTKLYTASHINPLSSLPEGGQIDFDFKGHVPIRCWDPGILFLTEAGKGHTEDPEPAGDSSGVGGVKWGREVQCIHPPTAQQGHRRALGASTQEAWHLLGSSPRPQIQMGPQASGVWYDLVPRM
eukprot:CAMPEP_0174302212 /NCGR_PEP_ID=MMETSP0809-20121228/59502_1 /TAXON_ID=73025 ORGANISM="Eutreptiella gymnastica-like, Strain CCMP1594" /NCGR_SAMPLE_ID=MMETSP0809 /ASSEMBLY_ACC=CAM_ASM_000658 /LENGTH=137 /DNA_ID=CAMNT_0015408091 /DNA_START=313 /DNA_END=727 /DNA_ORIENTATION=-